MKRRTPWSYFIIFFAILGIMSLPKYTTESLQGATIATFAPIWNSLLAVRSNTNKPSSTQADSSQELQKLQIENTLLREEILNLKNIMQHELDLLAQMQELLNEKDTPLSTKALRERHRTELLRLLQIQLQAIPAQVVFRSPSTWNSTLWINVGSETNTSLGTQTIAKNSPVLIGKAVIGVIDFVGRYQSRVRLITDSRLTPSVRAARGDAKTLLKKEKMRDIIKILYAEGNAFDDPQQQDALIEMIESTTQKLFSDSAPTTFLAKGEIHGSSKPLWRTQRNELHGIGFNYDFGDASGPPRDLRTGKVIKSTAALPDTPIIQSGDVLLTTGLDGIFPPGLPVAEVTYVHPLKEGDYYYEIDAQPIAGNMDDMTLVFVIPPRGYQDEGFTTR